MSHGAEHHIEEAEHAAHASHDGFNKNVTMSIAIVAAVLACVTMLGHRAHNETLRFQGEALDLQTKAGIKSTETANKWSYYQGKNLFSLEAEITIDLLKIVAIREDKKKEYDEIINGYEDAVKKYRGDKDYRTRSGDTGSDDPAKKKGKLAKIEKEANDLDEQRKTLQDEAKEMVKASHLEHARAERLDYGELFLQFGVVLCSLAILTRNRNFWFGGIGSAAVGAAVAVTGQFGMLMGHH